MIREFKLKDIDAIAEELSTRICHPIVLFDGSMGMGKTTLINALCKQLDSIDPVSSPTFSLVNEYKTKEGKSIFHFDCYRLESLWLWPHVASRMSIWCALRSNLGCMPFVLYYKNIIFYPAHLIYGIKKPPLNKGGFYS